MPDLGDAEENAALFVCAPHRACGAAVTMQRALAVTVPAQAVDAMGVTKAAYAGTIASLMGPFYLNRGFYDYKEDYYCAYYRVGSDLVGLAANTNITSLGIRASAYYFVAPYYTTLTSTPAKMPNMVFPSSSTATQFIELFDIAPVSTTVHYVLGRPAWLCRRSSPG